VRGRNSLSLIYKKEEEKEEGKRVRRDQDRVNGSYRLISLIRILTTSEGMSTTLVGKDIHNSPWKDASKNYWSRITVTGNKIITVQERPPNQNEVFLITLTRGVGIFTAATSPSLLWTGGRLRTGERMKEQVSLCRCGEERWLEKNVWGKRKKGETKNDWTTS